MHLSREALIRIARETAEKRALSDSGLVAAYLTGSMRTENPFLGNTTDVDIVFVHDGEPDVHREIIPLTPEIHLDIIHNPRSLYEKPKELRVHPWLGPELYDSLALYVTRHFFEFIQAGVRDRYHEPANATLRSQRLVEQARQVWSKLQAERTFGPPQILAYLKSIHLAANAIALQTGGLLAERRFLLQFPARAQAAGHPELAAALLNLLGATDLDAAAMTAFLPEWERAFLEAAFIPWVDARIAAARLGYYKLACQSMLESGTPQTGLWPLLLTWTLSVSMLPLPRQERWRSACTTLGLDEASFSSRMLDLDHFLDVVEATQENPTAGQGK